MDDGEKEVRDGSGGNDIAACAQCASMDSRAKAQGSHGSNQVSMILNSLADSFANSSKAEWAHRGAFL